MGQRCHIYLLLDATWKANLVQVDPETHKRIVAELPSDPRLGSIYSRMHEEAVIHLEPAHLDPYNRVTGSSFRQMKVYHRQDTRVRNASSAWKGKTRRPYYRV
jgi:hypothetical protein